VCLQMLTADLHKLPHQLSALEYHFGVDAKLRFEGQLEGGPHSTQKTVQSPVTSAHACPLPLSPPSFRTLPRYYTWPQMLAHHTLGGCNLRPGDMLGSGTISGGGVGQRGCLYEATSAGRDALELRPSVSAGAEPAAAVRRVYLEDGDEVVLTGRCTGPGGEVVSFGECRGRVLPCHPAPA
jgi:hypothetical protein